MARPRTPLGSYGTIAVQAVEYFDGGDGGRRKLQLVAQPDRRKHKFWRARTRYRFDDGTLRQIERFGESPAKAENALKEALKTVQASTAADVKRETRMRDLGERFLTSKAGLASVTVSDYTRIVRKVIVPRIGDLAVAEATADRLQRFLEAVAAENGPGASKTARAVLSGMMALAARSDAVKANPVRELAGTGVKPKGATAIPLEELPGILAKVRADKRLKQLDMADLIVFLAGTGVRIGEACALRWDDVDLGAGVVTIRKSKTEAGVRRISVPTGVLGMLADRRLSGGPSDAGVVFPTIRGRERNPRGTAGEWSDARDRLKLAEGYTFHAFRKTVATLLDQAGLSARDIAEYLGHANPAITQSVYMSKTVGGSRAAEAIDSIVSK